MKNPLKLILPVFVLLLFSINSNAADVRGYIISQNLDTIYGTIELPEINQTTGAVYIKGYDEEAISRRMKFKSDNENSFHNYTPKDIVGFGFAYQSRTYVFERFLLKYKSLAFSESGQYKFLNLIHKGNLSLYINPRYWILPTSNDLGNELTVYYEFYLYNDANGLVRVEKNKYTKTVRDLLLRFNVNKEFIDELPSYADFSNIQVILLNYDEWLLLHKTELEKKNRTRFAQNTNLHNQSTNN